MRLLKHQSEDVDELIIREGHRKVSAETAYFLNAAMKLDLEYEEETGGVDMCKAMERKEKKDKITGAIEILRLDGATDEDIIAKVMKLYDVTKDYVLAIMNAQVA
jgi:hypothetical protein